MITLTVFHVPSNKYIENVTGFRVIDKKGTEHHGWIQVYHDNGFSKFKEEDISMIMRQTSGDGNETTKESK